MTLPTIKGDQPVILPGQTIGIIGGGQLGRMMAIAARYMGYRIIVLDPTPNCPTGQVADDQIVAAYDDMSAIRELTRLSDVVTYEFENVDLKAAAYIENKDKLPQGTRALDITQNRQHEKELMVAEQLPVPKFHIVRDETELEKAMKDMTYPAVLKTCRGGYDGKGQIKLESITDAPLGVDFVNENGLCILEAWVPFEKEVSVVFSRAHSGDMAFFPIAENDHKDHILYKTTVPAQIAQSVYDAAIAAARTLAESLNVIGTFAIEMFVTEDGVLINEMAPRPHNSGHYTIEACNISQFTQHIRAICNLPLESVELLQPAVMVNILGEDMSQAVEHLQTKQSGYVHLYGKDEAKAKRKMGHVTFIAPTAEKVKQLATNYQEAKQ